MSNKSKHLTKRQIIALSVTVFILIWVAYSVSNPPQQSTKPTTSLTVDNFRVDILSKELIPHLSEGFYSVKADFDVTNNLSLRVQYVNVTVVFVEYTYSNGLVDYPLPSENTKIFKLPSYSVGYRVNLDFTVRMAGSDVTLTEARFIFTIFVQELASPIVWPVHLILTT